MDAALRVLGYLYRTRELGLNYVAEMKPVSGMTDSDWATKHSTTGWVFQYWRAAVSWGCEKQKAVALSSCEAKIMAASEAAKEAIYLRRFLEQFGLQDPEQPVALGRDNQAAINLAYNPEHHKRDKHIERRHFFIREKVEENMIEVPYVCTVDNLADFFTKPLVGDVFFNMRDQIMNCGKHAPMPVRSGAPPAARDSAAPRPDLHPGLRLLPSSRAHAWGTRCSATQASPPPPCMAAPQSPTRLATLCAQNLPRSQTGTHHLSNPLFTNVHPLRRRVRAISRGTPLGGGIKSPCEGIKSV
jgi:hypothetical protein